VIKGYLIYHRRRWNIGEAGRSKRFGVARRWEFDPLRLFLPLNCWLGLGKWVFHAHQKCRKKKKKRERWKEKEKNLGNYYFILYPLDRFVFVKGISFFWPYKNQSGYTKIVLYRVDRKGLKLGITIFFFFFFDGRPYKLSRRNERWSGQYESYEPVQ
jgi:hypothetical protein